MAITLPVVVWVRGPAEIETAAYVTRDRTTAWHLARGGCPAIALDTSPADIAGLDAELVVMRVVRAVHTDSGDMDWKEVDDWSFPRPTVRDGSRRNTIGGLGAFVLDVMAVETELGRLVDALSGQGDGNAGTPGVGLGAVQAAAIGLQAAIRDRDAAITATVDAGVPIARVADAAGVSRQSVYAIARGWTRPDRRR